jgi:catechol 2,3-dioxygenase-like lactoylglutathione lyase family enzyme
MTALQIKETCLYSRDLEVIKAFYHQKLGLPIISHVPEKHIFFRAGTSILLCFNPDDSRIKESPPPHYADGPLHFAFAVASSAYEKTKKEILDKGIQIDEEVQWPSGSQSFYFKDPIGNVLEILPAEGVWD